MGHTGASDATSSLLGRASECAIVDRLLDGAADGTSGVLVVRGEAGIGKSALLDYAAAQAAHFVVLRATGVEAEADLAFAGLYGLLRPIVDKLDRLPERQAAALAGGLGIAPSTEPDRLLVSAGVLGLLAAAAEERPVLCLVDDAQWLDKPSADALVFAARRLAAEQIVMLFGAREGDVRSFDAAGLADLVLAGLDPDAAAAMLSARVSRAPSAAVSARLLAEAHGNPLALLELPAGLTEGQLSGSEPLPEAIPLTPRLQGVFRQRIERLPESTQLALLVAAADDTGDAATIVRATAELDVPGDALDAAEAAGLVRAAAGKVVFRHPLVRSALYDGATLGQRRRVHAVLATVLSGDEHADRRIWHQATATPGGDEEVAAALEASARRSRARSAHASAATALMRAAELSTDPRARIRRLVEAATAAWDGGQADRAQDVIGRALPSAEGEQVAQLLYVRGMIEAHVGSVREAPAILLEAADATTDTTLQLELLQEAGEAAAYAGEMATVHRVAAREAAIPAVRERDRFLVAVQQGWVAAFAGDHRTADDAFARALALADALEDPRALVWASDSASAGMGLGSGLRYANRAVELARERGLLSLLPMALHRQAIELLWNSRFDLGYAAAQEGYRLAVDLGYGTGAHLANMATAEAVWGRDEDARRHAEEAIVIGGRSGSNLLTDRATSTVGFIELAAGRVDEATDRFLALTALDRSGAQPVIAMHAVPHLVEAAVRAGRAHEVVEPFTRYRAWARAASSDSGRALLARCEALLGERSADEAFAEAIALRDALSPFQHARTELLYGEWLRRERRRREARVHLRAALELFQSLGAAPWIERAEAELRATGETARKRDPSTLDLLTPQELQIAALVADGLTNRDIAAQLYLSPRTIDYHLRKVFTKLGIGSRTELVRFGLRHREPV